MLAHARLARACSWTRAARDQRYQLQPAAAAAWGALLSLLLVPVRERGCWHPATWFCAGLLVSVLLSNAGTGRVRA